MRRLTFYMLGFHSLLPCWPCWPCWPQVIGPLARWPCWRCWPYGLVRHFPNQPLHFSSELRIPVPLKTSSYASSVSSPPQGKSNIHRLCQSYPLLTFPGLLVPQAFPPSIILQIIARQGEPSINQQQLYQYRWQCELEFLALPPRQWLRPHPSILAQWPTCGSADSARDLHSPRHHLS